MTDFFLSAWFAEALKFLNSFIGNYGIAVIVFTLVVKILVSPLDMRQRKMTRKMNGLQGKMAAIKKRYANDQKKQNEKIQELYRAEGVSMFGSCLPALVSLPIWIALLGAVNIIANEQLVKLVVLENANPAKLEPFLWIRNMWQPDSGLSTVMPAVSKWTDLAKNFQNISILNTPDLIAKAQAINYETVIQPITTMYQSFANGWFILPLLSGVALFLQQKIMMQNSQQQQQSKIMLYGFPIFAIYICITASSVFSLYWIMSSVFTIMMNPIYDYLIDRKAKKTAATAELAKEE